MTTPTATSSPPATPTSTPTTTSTSPASSSRGHAVRRTHRGDGDFRVDGEPRALAARRLSVAGGPWTWLRQVHGAQVVTVTRPGEHAGVEADAAVTGVSGAALAIHYADCAPVVLTGHGVIGAAHAGWRGLMAGVIGATADAMRGLGATDLSASIGPCIGPECYEFGPGGLDAVAERFGEEVRGRTREGGPALDLRAAVTAALREAGVALDDDQIRDCTACRPDLYFSWRARAEAERMATVVWLEP